VLNLENDINIYVRVVDPSVATAPISTA